MLELSQVLIGWTFYVPSFIHSTNTSELLLCARECSRCVGAAPIKVDKLPVLKFTKSGGEAQVNIKIRRIFSGNEG